MKKEHEGNIIPRTTERKLQRPYKIYVSLISSKSKALYKYLSVRVSTFLLIVAVMATKNDLSRSDTPHKFPYCFSLKREKLSQLAQH